MGWECSCLDPSYERHITFACTGCYLLHPHHRLEIFTRLIVDANLPTSKVWIAWLAMADCTHITFSQGYYKLNPKAPEGNEPRLSSPRPTQCHWTNRAVHYRPRIKSQKTPRSAVGVEPTTFRTAATDDDKD